MLSTGFVPGWKQVLPRVEMECFFEVAWRFQGAVLAYVAKRIPTGSERNRRKRKTAYYFRLIGSYSA